MKKLVLVLISALTLFSTQACAQRKIISDFSFRKALEAYYDDDDDDKALELVNKQLDETPDHLDSRFLRAQIYWRADKNDAALRDLAYAIKHYKGEPQVYKSTLWGLRGAIYDEMERYSDAAESYRQAVKFAKKDNPERVQRFYFDLAQALYQDEQFNESEKVYRTMLKNDPGDAAAMLGIARFYRDKQDYQASLDWLEKAASYNSEYGEIYKFKMQVYDKMGREDDAVDAALKYFELDNDAEAWYVADYASKHYSYGVARIKAEMNKDDANSRWIVLLTRMYEDHGDYLHALELYDRVEKEYGEHEMISYYKSGCYREIGQFKKAISEATKAIELSGDKSFYSHRGDIYRSTGMYKEAIADYQVSMDNDPSNGYEYYAIGWCYELQGNKDKAMEYYNQGIDLDKTYAYLFISRGDLLKERGDIEGATADYEKVLELDDDPDDGSCRQYALLGLGRDSEALEWMGKIIENNPNDNGVYYDKACLLARMGRAHDAINALEEAFKKGFRRFAHLEHDDDMNTLRGLKEYKELVQKYKDMPVEEQDDEPEITIETAEALISEIQMKKMPGGTYEVPCTINGLPLKFIFDTGASDVTISSVEANFMLKNDYLSEKDFKGSRRYLTADGTIANGAIVRIKEVKVGDVTLKNIEASVVNSQKAPLLLGQSALDRFGTITIDNQKSIMTIKYTPRE